MSLIYNKKGVKNPVLVKNWLFINFNEGRIMSPYVSSSIILRLSSSEIKQLAPPQT